MLGNQKTHFSAEYNYSVPHVGMENFILVMKVQCNAEEKIKKMLTVTTTGC